MVVAAMVAPSRTAQERCLNKVLQLDTDNILAFAGLAFAPGRKLTEADAVRLRPHPYEFALYYDI